MRYFVTGATGFVGGQVARQLLERGDEVIALARDPARADKLVQLGASVHRGDITDRESMRDGMSGVGGVFHVAGWYVPGARDRGPAVPVNVDGTRNVLELAHELAISRIVYTSTLAVNSDTRGQIVDEMYRYEGGAWLSEYDRTKWLAHYTVAEPMIQKGLPLVIVQPGMIYGPGDTGAMHRIFVQYLRGFWPIAPRQTAFCWGHVEDMARGHLLAMDRGRLGETYIIAGPAHTLIDAFETGERITGIRAPRLRPGPAFFRTMEPFIAAIEDYVPLPEAFRSENVRISAGATYLGRSDKARRELGFAARSLEQGFRDWLPLELELLRGQHRS